MHGDWFVVGFALTQRSFAMLSMCGAQEELAFSPQRGSKAMAGCFSLSKLELSQKVCRIAGLPGAWARAGSSLQVSLFCRGCSCHAGTPFTEFVQTGGWYARPSSTKFVSHVESARYFASRSAVPCAGRPLSAFSGVAGRVR